MSILSINLSVVLIWLILWKCGASIEWQTYVVVMMGLLVTFGFYKLMKIQQFGGSLSESGYPKGTAFWHFFLKLGERSHLEKGSMWKWISRLMDRHC